MTPSNDIQELIGYRFTHESLLEEALVTAGNEHPCNETEAGKPANKRLALVGDAVLRLAIVDHWWEQGDTSRQSCENDCQQLASNQNLSKRGHTLGLDTQVQKNPAHKGDVPRTAMASTMEAVIGAAWLDSGRDWSVTRDVANRLYKKA